MKNLESNILSQADLQRILPNSTPWLFVDEITDYISGKYAKGYKCFSSSDWYFQGHFDGDPNVPGVILTEVLSQTFLVTFLTLPEYSGKATGNVFESSKFFRRVVPNDKLEVEAELTYFKRGIAKGKAVGRVEGAVAIEAEFSVAILEVLERYKPRA